MAAAVCSASASNFAGIFLTPVLVGALVMHGATGNSSFDTIVKAGDGGHCVISRRLGFSREDRIAIVFCGSKKSMATGVPMAKVLFATSSLGVLLVPLMVFHQIQLMVCALLAQHYANRSAPQGRIAQ